MYMDLRLIERLDTFRFRHKFESRSQAAVWLMEAALAAKVVPGKDDGGAK